MIKTIEVDLSNTISKSNQKSNKNHNVGEPTKKSIQKTPQNQQKKRVITTTEKWNVSSPNTHFECIKQIHTNTIQEENKELCKLISQEIQRKISGYRAQDVHKSLLLESAFVDIDKVLELLIKMENLCFYCKEPVQVLYENVREPKQWTLDRIDNDFGHNKDNVMIACLNCNLRRRTMYHERYVFTKQLNIVKTET